jgi:hypothetical protein
MSTHLLKKILYINFHAWTNYNKITIPVPMIKADGMAPFMSNPEWDKKGVTLKRERLYD